ncbi:MAG: glycosyltransferase, partial [Muribaculaceae bacterium]|nr:glycosyltransferase [Muribaculaceae bacterium]
MKRNEADGQTLVSVIVPVYKVERYLGRCVESIRQQTYGNLEIILVDDGSPDGCPELCDRFAE